MIIHSLTFYLLAAVTLASGVMVISARNPVHSVLFLILAFINSAGLFVLMGAEFLAMIMIIVYVGAVAVLFVFVVMMLDINFTELRQGFLQYLPVGGLVGFIMLVELLLILGGWVIQPQAVSVVAAPTPAVADVSNTEALGMLIYTRYVYLFQAAGMVLLIAMIGAIVLTLRTRVGVRKQSISQQVSRRREEAVEIKQVAPGSGI